ncbi:nascent polypeptide-associated complex subunit alpha, muscle-specific form-like [Cynocephalus volans]|uniref:nascent polypeptide-associated complex subunit alpha, muscle-specific form-like n=1 Tax=Cynocephalus volans TaxID=110931 RepID=UPI002FC74A42
MTTYSFRNFNKGGTSAARPGSGPGASGGAGPGVGGSAQSRVCCRPRTRSRRPCAVRGARRRQGSATVDGGRGALGPSPDLGALGWVGGSRMAGLTSSPPRAVWVDLDQPPSPRGLLSRLQGCPRLSPSAPVCRRLSPSAPGCPPSAPGCPPAAPPAVPRLPPVCPGLSPSAPGCPPSAPVCPRLPRLSPGCPRLPLAVPWLPPSAPDCPPLPPSAPGCPPAAPVCPRLSPGCPRLSPGCPPAAPRLPPGCPPAVPVCPRLSPSAPVCPPSVPRLPPAAQGQGGSDIVVPAGAALPSQPQLVLAGNRGAAWDPGTAAATVGGRREERTTPGRGWVSRRPLRSGHRRALRGKDLRLRGVPGTLTAPAAPGIREKHKCQGAGRLGDLTHRVPPPAPRPSRRGLSLPPPRSPLLPSVASRKQCAYPAAGCCPSSPLFSTPRKSWRAGGAPSLRKGLCGSSGSAEGGGSCPGAWPSGAPRGSHGRATGASDPRGDLERGVGIVRLSCAILCFTRSEAMGLFRVVAAFLILFTIEETEVQVGQRGIHAGIREQICAWWPGMPTPGLCSCSFTVLPPREGDPRSNSLGPPMGSQGAGYCVTQKQQSPGPEGDEGEPLAAATPPRRAAVRGRRRAWAHYCPPRAGPPGPPGTGGTEAARGEERAVKATEPGEQTGLGANASGAQHGARTALGPDLWDPPLSVTLLSAPATPQSPARETFGSQLHREEVIGVLAPRATLLLGRSRGHLADKVRGGAWVLASDLGPLSDPCCVVVGGPSLRAPVGASVSSPATPAPRPADAPPRPGPAPQPRQPR